MMRKIWQRYILKQHLSAFLFLLFLLTLLFSMIDYTLHLSHILKEQQEGSLFSYYLAFFITNSPILIPLSLLLATIHTLFSLNRDRELVALQAAGISRNALLKPFLLVAFGCTLFSYTSLEFFLPRSVAFLATFGKERHEEKKPQIIELEDKTHLIYQEHKEGILYEVIWAKSSNELWKIKRLTTEPNKPKAYFANHLKRQKSGVFELVQSHPEINLEGLVFPSQIDTFIPIAHRKISTLIKQLINNSSTFKRAEMTTHLLEKLLTPLLPVLIVITAAPFCMRYSRKNALYLLYGLGVFLLFSFFMFFSSCVILGENNLLHPLISCALPTALFFLISWMRFRKFAKSCS